MFTIQNVFRNKEENESNIIYVNSTLITNKGKKGLFKRNETVMVKNKDNGEITFATIKAKNSLNKKSALISYDLAVEIGVDFSKTFSRSGHEKPVESNLIISEPSLYVYLTRSLKSSNKIVRSTAIFSLVGGINLAYTVVKDTIQFFGFIFGLM